MPTWMQEQIGTLLAQYVDRPANSAWIGVASTAGLHGKPESRLYRRGGQIVQFGEEDVADSFVWQPEESGLAPELWVAPKRESYRSDYATFLSIYWPGSDINEAPNHVDHLFPKGPAQLGGLSHVRLLAIPRRSNVSAGTLEKKMAQRNRALGARTKRTRLATPYSIAKATGYVGYAGLNDAGRRREIAAGILSNLRLGGIDPEATSALDEELLTSTLTDLR